MIVELILGNIISQTLHLYPCSRVFSFFFSSISGSVFFVAITARIGEEITRARPNPRKIAGLCSDADSTIE